MGSIPPPRSSGWEAAGGRGGGGLEAAEAAARCGGPVPSVMDVPVIMQVEFQQSSLYVWMVPQNQFIDRVLQPPVYDVGVFPQCKLCRRPARSHRCCSQHHDNNPPRLVPGSR